MELIKNAHALYRDNGPLSPHASQVPHQSGAYPGFSSKIQLRAFLLPLDVMLVYHRVIPALNSLVPIYACVERRTVRVKFLAQEHNKMSPVRARTQTARFGVKRTNHEATASPQRGKTGTKKPNSMK